MLPPTFKRQSPSITINFFILSPSVSRRPSPSPSVHLSPLPCREHLLPFSIFLSREPSSYLPLIETLRSFSIVSLLFLSRELLPSMFCFGLLQPLMLISSLHGCCDYCCFISSSSVALWLQFEAAVNPLQLPFLSSVRSVFELLLFSSLLWLSVCYSCWHFNTIFPIFFLLSPWASSPLIQLVFIKVDSFALDCDWLLELVLVFNLG